MLAHVRDGARLTGGGAGKADIQDPTEACKSNVGDTPHHQLSRGTGMGVTMV